MDAEILNEFVRRLLKLFQFEIEVKKGLIKVAIQFQMEIIKKNP